MYYYQVIYQNNSHIEDKVTVAIHCSLPVLSMVFHVVTIAILLIQVTKDFRGNERKKVMSYEAEGLFFVTGALLVWFALYLSQNDAETLTNILEQIYMVTIGFVVGILVLFLGSLLYTVKPSLLSRLQTLCGYQNGNGNREPVITTEDSEQQPLLIDNNDLNEDTQNNRYQATNLHGPEDLEGNTERRSISQDIHLYHNQPYFGSFLAVTTFPIILLELILIFTFKGDSGTTDNTENTEQDDQVSDLYNMAVVIYMIQIIVQFLCYVFLLKDCKISLRFAHSAELFFKYMAFFNFTMVLNSLWDCSWKRTKGYESMRLSETVYKTGFNIIYAIYSALILNTRVLFLYFFMHCAKDLVKKFSLCPISSHETEGEQLSHESHEDYFLEGQMREQMENAQNLVVPQSRLRDNERMSRNLGICIGMAFVCLQFLSSLQYIEKLQIGPWVDIFSIFVNIAVVVAGTVFIKINTRNSPNIVFCFNSMRFMRTVNILGVLGFLFYLLKDILVISRAYWVSHDVESHAVWWVVCRQLSQTVVLVSLIVIINMVNDFATPMIRRQDLTSHVLAPVLMFGVLSVAVGFAADQYAGQVIYLIRNLTDPTIELLLEIGVPIVLAFYINVFYCLLIVFLK